ncbi:hypothetical protein SH601_12770 [Gracilibacillus sp. S3-1-1]|uniref:Uncharacterized protein n=1 Tax=Gracilibacillus pellucidus TaxID=3095368 RepID=A0ACC6M7A1_9BACI|nr:hypothetical protein [Gracilibacillus sp. S3-1-1]MDX8046858.1 hypothetical protein [Gracilibacillus sp. S3-1-1]
MKKSFDYKKKMNKNRSNVTKRVAGLTLAVSIGVAIPVAPATLSSADPLGLTNSVVVNAAEVTDLLDHHDVLTSTYAGDSTDQSYSNYTLRNTANPTVAINLDTDYIYTVKFPDELAYLLNNDQIVDTIKNQFDFSGKVVGNDGEPESFTSNNYDPAPYVTINHATNSVEFNITEFHKGYNLTPYTEKRPYTDVYETYMFRMLMTTDYQEIAQGDYIFHIGLTEGSVDLDAVSNARVETLTVESGPVNTPEDPVDNENQDTNEDPDNETDQELDLDSDNDDNLDSNEDSDNETDQELDEDSDDDDNLDSNEDSDNETEQELDEDSDNDNNLDSNDDSDNETDQGLDGDSDNDDNLDSNDDSDNETDQGLDEDSDNDDNLDSNDDSDNETDQGLDGDSDNDNNLDSNDDSDNETDQGLDGDSDNDDNLDSNDDSDNETDQGLDEDSDNDDENKLPDTATSTWKYGMAGAIALLCGIATQIIGRFKRTE